MLHAFVRVCCLTLGLVILSPRLHAQSIDPSTVDIGPHVRGATPSITALIKSGIRRSATFASLVDALNHTDVIVYIEMTRSLPDGVDGRLMFSGTTSPFRYVRAQVSMAFGESALLAVAAHELQHALEVAEHAEVGDVRSFGELYERIGVAGTRNHTYDTAAAQRAGRRVRAELS